MLIYSLAKQKGKKKSDMVGYGTWPHKINISSFLVCFTHLMEVHALSHPIRAKWQYTKPDTFLFLLLELVIVYLKASHTIDLVTINANYTLLTFYVFVHIEWHCLFSHTAFSTQSRCRCDHKSGERFAVPLWIPQKKKKMA